MPNNKRPSGGQSPSDRFKRTHVGSGGCVHLFKDEGPFGPEVKKFRRRNRCIYALKPNKPLVLSSISLVSFSKQLPPPMPLQGLSQWSKIGSGIMARVLIVDDEPTDRVIVGSIVEEAGHEVHFASDGGEALRVYWTRKIDVVVTDLHMPHTDGLQFIEALRASFPEAVIIAVSGKGPGLLAAAKNKGAFGTLSKPVDPDKLVRAITSAGQGNREGP